MLASGTALDEDGIESAFELEGEVTEVVKTGRWVGDCFIFTNDGPYLDIWTCMYIYI